MIRQTSNLYTDLMELDWEKVRDFDYIVVHCSATKDGKTVSARAIDEYHKDPKGADFGPKGCGYHVLVENAPEDKTPDAMTIWIGRSLYENGVHASGFNTRSAGVCCVGDWDVEAPSGRHWDTTAWVVMLLLKMYKEKKGKDLKVVGHREVYAILNEPQKKTCPGTKWDMDLFRKIVGATNAKV